MCLQKLTGTLKYKCGNIAPRETKHSIWSHLLWFHPNASQSCLCHFIFPALLSIMLSQTFIMRCSGDCSIHSDVCITWCWRCVRRKWLFFEQNVRNVLVLLNLDFRIFVWCEREAVRDSVCKCWNFYILSCKRIAAKTTVHNSVNQDSYNSTKRKQNSWAIKKNVVRNDIIFFILSVKIIYWINFKNK